VSKAIEPQMSVDMCAVGPRKAYGRGTAAGLGTLRAQRAGVQAGRV
jgi:hypothetical protein